MQRGGERNRGMAQVRWRMGWAFALAAAVWPAAAQSSSDEIRLIAQGDDMGAAHGINTGTLQAYKEGILRATNVLMPSGWVPEAAVMLAANPGLDVGVHLTLTSEWETVRWRPLTNAPSLRDVHGYLFRSVEPRTHWTLGTWPAGSSLLEGKPSLGDVEKELRAQIELARTMFPRLSYLSVHMGFGAAAPEIAALLQGLAREYGLATARDYGIRPVGKVWEPMDLPGVRAEKLAAKLATLGPGTWLMVEHCATNTAEIQALREDVPFDRSGVVAAWTHPKVLEAVRKRGIRLTNYRELAAGK